MGYAGEIVLAHRKHRKLPFDLVVLNLLVLMLKMLVVLMLLKLVPPPVFRADRRVICCFFTRSKSACIADFT